MCKLARALVNHGRLMKIATFSTRDLQEQCCKSYVASYRANKESVGDLANTFSRTTSMKVICCESFFRERFPIVRYFIFNYFSYLVSIYYHLLIFI